MPLCETFSDFQKIDITGVAMICTTDSNTCELHHSPIKQDDTKMYHLWK